MSKKCDNTSVGVIIRHKDGRFAMIERRNFPQAFAFIAGHGDGDIPEDASKKEAREEGGIVVLAQKLLLAKRYENPCKREGGTHHDWSIFEATQWEGALKADSDAKASFWADQTRLESLAKITDEYAKMFGLSMEELARNPALVVGEESWKKNPGLEPVWVLILRDIGILKF